MLPERFGELGGTEVSIQVLVKEVKAAQAPGGRRRAREDGLRVRHADELRDDLRERLVEMKEREAEGVDARPRAGGDDRHRDVDLPETLVDEETEHRVAHARERAERAGLTLEQLLEAQGWDEARLREDSRDHAVRAIKADLVLEGVARAEELEVTAEEIGAEIAALAQATAASRRNSRSRSTAAARS